MAAVMVPGMNPIAAIRSMGIGNLIAVPIAIKLLMYVKYKVYSWVVQVSSHFDVSLTHLGSLSSSHNGAHCTQEYEITDEGQKDAIALFFASHPSRLDR